MWKDQTCAPLYRLVSYMCDDLIRPCLKALALDSRISPCRPGTPSGTEKLVGPPCTIHVVSKLHAAHMYRRQLRPFVQPSTACRQGRRKLRTSNRNCYRKESGCLAFSLWTALRRLLRGGDPTFRAPTSSRIALVPHTTNIRSSGVTPRQALAGQPCQSDLKTWSYCRRTQRSTTH